MQPAPHGRMGLTSDELARLMHLEGEKDEEALLRQLDDELFLNDDFDFDMDDP